MTYQSDTPFDSIESAQEYIALLEQAIQEAKETVESDLSGADGPAARRVEALRIVLFKLEKLHHHSKATRRLLNDLRSLRRLLLDERNAAAGAISNKSSEP
jgi:hypothetical protein